jgi:hypothetical protein
MSFPVALARSAGLLALLASVSAAQQSAVPTAPTRGSVGGLVLDAATLAPLENATIALTPSTGQGAFPSRNGSPFFTDARVASTARNGAYEFSDLPIGAYRLYVRRLGYEPATVDVELTGATTSPLSVGLTVVPVRLRAMRVQPTDSLARSALGVASFYAADDSARVNAARLRQQQFLGTDVREVTHADVTEAATLGGSDLFRALQRLPGVSSYDDWSTDLWIRGARWDQTRVYFDGLPLLNPLHAHGTISGIGSTAISAAVLHPGVRPVSIGREGATMLDLQSRAGGGTGGIRGTGELSTHGATLSLDQARRDGRAAWMVSARRSTGDLIPGMGWFNGASLPNGSNFGELVARGDLDLGGGKRLEASGLATRDYLGLTGSYFPTESGWRNAMGRVTLRLPLGGLATTHTVGKSKYSAQTPQTPLAISTSDSLGINVNVPRSMMLRMWAGTDYIALSGEVRPRNNANTWSAGYSVVSEHASFYAPRFLLAWDDLSDAERGEDERLSYTTFWAQRRWQATPRLTLDGGLRLDVGGKFENARGVRPAPTLQARYSLDPVTQISIGVGRSFQYVQELPLLSTSRGQFTPGISVIAGRVAPYVQNDQATIGVERWSGNGVLLGANLYARRSAGIVSADPTPGTMAGRPFFVSTEETAQGVELSARRLAGRITGSAAYSFGRATRIGEGLRYAAPGDRRHALDATAMVRLGNFRLGGALSAMSGLPYTRVDAGRIVKARVDDEPNASTGPSYEWSDTLVYDSPNDQRFPNFATFDLMADWTRQVRRTDLTFFLQVANVLGRRNYTRYSPVPNCSSQIGDDSFTCAGGDFLYTASPYRPVTMGARIKF